MAVIISRVGVVTPYGRGLDIFKEGLQKGIVALQSHEPLRWLESDKAGVVPNIGFKQYLKRRKAAKLMTPSARLAMDAVGQISDQVALSFESLGLFLSVGREPPDEGGAESALIASSVNGQFSELAMATKGRDLYPPLLPLKTLPNLILGHLSIHFGFCGENAAWAGEGVQSLLEGYWSLVEGRSDAVIVGAADSLIDLGQARDLLRMGVKHPPSQAAVAFLMHRVDTKNQSGIAKLTYTGTESHDTDMHLESLLGHCGVVTPQLQLLSMVAGGRSGHWNGLKIEALI